MVAPTIPPISRSTYFLTTSLSLLLLGLFLSALATLNFSLSLLLGLLCVPIVLSDRDRGGIVGFLTQTLLIVVSPMGLWIIAYAYFTFWLGDDGWAATTLARVAFGWNVLGSWGVGVGVLLVWWPAWLTAMVLTLSRSQSGQEDGQGRIKTE